MRGKFLMIYTKWIYIEFHFNVFPQKLLLKIENSNNPSFIGFLAIITKNPVKSLAKK